MLEIFYEIEYKNGEESDHLNLVDHKVQFHVSFLQSHPVPK